MAFADLFLTMQLTDCFGYRRPMCHASDRPDESSQLSVWESERR